MKPTIQLGGDTRIHKAIGASVHEYSRVESAQVGILEAILTIKTVPASILFHSIQNVRTRNEMIQGLLRYSYGDKFKSFWAKCSAFLFKLSVYRNAIVHWHPHINIYVDEKHQAVRATNALGNPMYGKGGKSLEVTDFPPFDQDCRYIAEELYALARFLKQFKPDETLPDKYQRPIIRPNRADLQPPPKTKEPGPRRPPSVPKLSAAQRRAKARKDSRLKAK